MNPDALVAGLIFGTILGSLGVAIMWLVSNERPSPEQRRLMRANADLRTLAETIVEDNIGLAAENADLYVRLSMALDAELLSSPNTVIQFPTQWTSSDFYDVESEGL